MPRPPEPTEPVAIPLAEFGGGALWERLADQRRILVSGPLDRDAVTNLSAQLMALDGRSSREIELVINSTGGPISEIFAALDVIGLMRAPVKTTCVGAAVGTAAALVASGTGERRAAAHARLSLRHRDTQTANGATNDLLRLADEVAAQHRRYLDLLAATTGQELELIEAEVDHGSHHDPIAAQKLGIIDAIA